MIEVSKEAAETLAEIIANEGVPNYWENRFDGLSHREDSILRGCFKELRENNLISTQWAEGYPAIIFVLKDGYLYEEHLRAEREKEAMVDPQFETEMSELLDRTSYIVSPIDQFPIGPSLDIYRQKCDEWINDFQIFAERYLKAHPLYPRLEALFSKRTSKTYAELVSCLKSISKDKAFIQKQNEAVEMTSQPGRRSFAEYDVFLSHANKDKKEIVDELNESLKKLGVSVFYDKESIEWGDIWKQRILEGTQKAEFAIIVISENFFGREWTERELSEFLNRQNKNGQKLILPIIHGISNQQLREKYPAVADIQCISTSDHSCDEIALLFAKQLIKRLKSY